MSELDQMPLNYHALMSWPFDDVLDTWSKKDSMLYALGLGLGQDPTDPAELQYVFEEGLRTLPTIAVVLGRPGFFLQDPRAGVEWRSVLHGEQRLTIHAPLPPEGTFISSNRVERVIDKGEGRGALVYATRETRHAGTDQLLATQTSTLFCRSDGGFGGPSGPVAPVQLVPDGPPDASLTRGTLPQAALIYRLSGDWNPIHADPQLASAVGFPRPILHGLCTYGIAGHSIVQMACGGEPERLRRLDVRFSAPVFPGESITTKLWHEGAGRAAFRCTVEERGATVIDNGIAEFDV